MESKSRNRVSINNNMNESDSDEDYLEGAVSVTKRSPYARSSSGAFAKRPPPATTVRSTRATNILENDDDAEFPDEPISAHEKEKPQTNGSRMNFQVPRGSSFRSRSSFQKPNSIVDISSPEFGAASRGGGVGGGSGVTSPSSSWARSKPTPISADDDETTDAAQYNARPKSWTTAKSSPSDSPRNGFETTSSPSRSTVKPGKVSVASPGTGSGGGSGVEMGLEIPDLSPRSSPFSPNKPIVKPVSNYNDSSNNNNSVNGARSNYNSNNDSNLRITVDVGSYSNSNRSTPYGADNRNDNYNNNNNINNNNSNRGQSQQANVPYDDEDAEFDMRGEESNYSLSNLSSANNNKGQQYQQRQNQQQQQFQHLYGAKYSPQQQQQQQQNGASNLYNNNNNRGNNTNNSFNGYSNGTGSANYNLEEYPEFHSSPARKSGRFSGNSPNNSNNNNNYNNNSSNNNKVNNQHGGIAMSPKVVVPFVIKCHPSGRCTEHIQCVLIRERGSMQGKMFPTYILQLEESQKDLILAKKMNMNRTSNYHLFDLTRGQISGSKLTKKSGNYLGKLRATNRSRSEYVLVTHSSERQEVAGIMFDRIGVFSQLLDGSQPRKLRVFLPAVDETGTPIPRKLQDSDDKNVSIPTAFQMILQSASNGNTNTTTGTKRSGGTDDGNEGDGEGGGGGAGEGGIILETKEPVYDHGNYRLNFRGRVSEPSVKNFQLVSNDDIENIICQFGKVGEDRYHLDYKYPMNAFQAMAAALSQFDI